MAEPDDPVVDLTKATSVLSSSSVSCDTAAIITKKRSLVWVYFRESSGVQREAVCNLCEEKISTCGNTTNMVKVSNMYR